MNKTLDLQQKRASVLEAADAIASKATGEGRPMSADELTSYNANLEEVEGIDRTIAAMAKRSAIAANGGSNQQHRETIERVADLYLEKPFGYDTHPQLWDNRASETAEQKSLRLYSGFGDQLRVIRAAAMNPHAVDQRLLELNKRAPSGMSEQIPADGGFLIYPDFATEVLRLAHDTGMVYTKGRKLPLSEATNAIRIPAIDQTSRADGSRWGGVKAYWANEADALTATKPKFRLIELTTKKLTALYYATDELIADATLLGTLVTQAFGEEFGFRLDDAAINGDGSGKPQGILNSPAVIAVNKESGQASSTVVWQNILKMWFRLWIRSRATAVWFVNQDVEQQLMQMSTNTTYGVSIVAGVAPAQANQSNYVPIYIPPNPMWGQPFGTLMGRPVIPIEQCASLTNQGDIILCDMSQWIYVDKGDPQNAVSMHVKFLTDEMTYRSIYRVDGQGWWHSALTPANGSNTVSPFVTLQAR